jgi:hypothetical protein
MNSYLARLLSRVGGTEALCPMAQSLRQYHKKPCSPLVVARIPNRILTSPERNPTALGKIMNRNLFEHRHIFRVTFLNHRQDHVYIGERIDHIHFTGKNQTSAKTLQLNNSKNSVIGKIREAKGFIRHEIMRIQDDTIHYLRKYQMHEFLSAPAIILRSNL